MRRFVAAASALALASCVTATTRLDSSRPIAVRPGAFADRYEQDGKPIADLEDRLQEHPAAGPKLEGIGSKRGAALAFGLAGSFLIGWNAGSNLGRTLDAANKPGSEAKTDYKLSLVGLGLMLVGIPFNVMANRQLSSAVEAYNASVVSGPLPALAVPAPAAPPAPVLGGAPPPTADAPQPPEPPRRLSGPEITAHFKAHPVLRANLASKPVTITIDPGGALRRECASCQRTTAQGMLVVKEPEAEACFSWVRVTYPEAGCFQVVQAGAGAYQVRDAGGRIILEYQAGP